MIKCEDATTHYAITPLGRHRLGTFYTVSYTHLTLPTKRIV